MNSEHEHPAMRTVSDLGLDWGDELVVDLDSVVGQKDHV